MSILFHITFKKKVVNSNEKKIYDAKISVMCKVISKINIFFLMKVCQVILTDMSILECIDLMKLQKF